VALVAAMAGCSVVGDVVRRPIHGVDLNAASVDEVAKLPGLSEADAVRIVDRRPYQTEADLVSWGIVSQEQFDRFEMRAYVSRVQPEGETRSCAAIGTPPPEPAASEPSRESADESPEETGDTPPEDAPEDSSEDDVAP
jgi:hypothetical protein